MRGDAVTTRQCKSSRRASQFRIAPRLVRAGLGRQHPKPMVLLIMAIVGGLILILVVVFALLSFFLGPLVDWIPDVLYELFRKKRKDDGPKKD